MDALEYLANLVIVGAPDGQGSAVQLEVARFLKLPHLFAALEFRRLDFDDLEAPLLPLELRAGHEGFSLRARRWLLPVITAEDEHLFRDLKEEEKPPVEQYFFAGREGRHNSLGFCCFCCLHLISSPVSFHHYKINRLDLVALAALSLRRAIAQIFAI